MAKALDGIRIGDYLFVHGVTPDMFQALMRVIGRPDLAAELLANEHLRGRGLVVDLEHPDASPTDVRRAPLLGEHTAEVLGGLLGLSADELARLREDGAV